MTNRLGLDLSTVVADSLQDFLDLGQETYTFLSALLSNEIKTHISFEHTDVENRGCQLDVPKVTRTLLLAFLASLAVPLAINRTQTRIIKTLCSRSLPLVVLFSVSANSQHPDIKKKKTRKTNHCFWVFDMDDTHPFDLLRREETKLDLLNRAQRRLRVWEENVRHDGRFVA